MFVRWCSSLLDLFWFNLSRCQELTSDDDEETVNLASETIFRSCALLFGLKRKGVILYGFKATCSPVNTGLTPLGWSLTVMEIFEHDNRKKSDSVFTVGGF